MRRSFFVILSRATICSLLSLTLLSIPAESQATDVERHLRDQYQGKTLLLRGFLSGYRLHYGATGLPDKPRSGDWTEDGFVEVGDISLSGQRLAIKAKRLFVVAGQGLGFHFVADSPKRTKRAPSLEISAELGSAGSPSEQVEAAMSRIFLTTEDAFAELVPAYWKPCVPDGLSGKDSDCHFSPQISVVPGVASTGPRNPATENTPRPAVTHVGAGVSPPGIIRQQDPKLSDAADAADVRGTVILMLVVDASGVPQNIRVVRPMGCGLDLQAVRAVGSWRFDPAEKDGRPVAVEIAVEARFQ